MFRFRCPKCGQTFENPEDLTGKPCPLCEAVVDDWGSTLRLAPGDRIGGYEIIRLLGSGGTGNVYLALQLSMSRQIALKVLYPELTQDSDSVNQFLGEVKTLGIIQHANIVCAFDSGMDEERGLYYLAMQYLPGQPLDAIVTQSGPLPILKALRIVENIAEALNYVWTKYQLCHRDIKPGNIILNENDVPMLLDFGAVLHPGDNSISNGMVEGSPCFMSPEQARGEKLTFASDLYSLGETLYYLIVGVVPFDDPDVREVLRKQCEEPFPLPGQRKPGSSIPQEVISLLRKTMAKSPVDRFESWDAFLAELKKVKKALSKSTAAKGSARSPLSKPVPRTTVSPTAKGPSPNRQVMPPVQKKKNWVFALINYLLISLFTAGGICYMLSRSNTQSAENRMIEVEAAMNNVLEKGKDPERAKATILRAKAETRKFGVEFYSSFQRSIYGGKGVAQEINEKCDAYLQTIEGIEAEPPQVKQIHSKVIELIAKVPSARTAWELGRSGEERAALVQIRAELEEQAAKLREATFVLRTSKDAISLDIDALEKQIKTISGLLNPTPAAPGETAGATAPGKTTTPAAATRTAAGSGNSSAATAKPETAQDREARRKKEEEEKARRKERYLKGMERKKASVARDVVLKIRNGKLKEVESLLAVGPGMKVPDDPDCRKAEAAYTAWLAKLRNIYLEVKPVLLKVTLGTAEDNKARINALTEGNKRLRCRSLILFGYFTEAQELAAQTGDQELLRDISTAYLTHRIERALKDARNGNDQELVELRQEYENFKSYTDLENSIRARIFGGK